MRRRQFIIGRTLLRFAVAHLTGLSPDLIYIEESSGNQPRLLFPQGHCITLNFSLSHSGKWAACATSLEAVLGVDIEVNDPNRNFGAIVEIAFGSREKAWLLAQSCDRRTEAFYSLWCAQEALFKLLCNRDHQNELSTITQGANAPKYQNSGHYLYQLRVGDLTVAIISDRQLSALQQRGLTDADRRKWAIPAEDDVFSNNTRTCRGSKQSSR